LLQSLRIIDQEVWQKVARNFLKMLHKYKGRDMAKVLDIFDKEVLDDEGEPHNVRKCDEMFFERITGILPVHIKHLGREHLIRVLEILVKKELGSERIFRDHLLLKIERNIYRFSIDQYNRLIRALADK
jgi:hypothetical protein